MGDDKKDDKPTKTETKQADASIGDMITGDSDKDGGKTHHGKPVMETTEKK